MSMTPTQIRVEAQAFAIWRQGHSVGWDCTLTELEDITGVPQREVRAICVQRRWPVQRGANRRDTADSGDLFVDLGAMQ